MTISLWKGVSFGLLFKGRRILRPKEVLVEKSLRPTVLREENKGLFIS